MEIPGLRHRTPGEETVNMGGSLDIAMYGLRMASKTKQDELYPEDKKKEIDEVLATIYSIDTPAVSFNLAATKYKAIKYLLGHRKGIIPILKKN